VNVWPLPSSSILATVGRTLYRSTDRGETWQVSRHLPASSGPMGVLPTAVETDGDVTYLGEYPLDSSQTPRILASPDYGRTWKTAVSLPDIRHVHAVKRDPYTGDIWVTTGDTDGESRIGRLRGGSFEPVGGGSQDWRAVEPVFTPSSVLWGVDCVYATCNPIFRLSRSAIDADTPEPEPVHAVDGSVFYGVSLTADDETWVVFSTAMESGRDSTGPANQSGGESPGVVVASSSASDFTDWREIATYERRQCAADRVPFHLPRSNGYVFLGADPDLGLFVNPFNTKAADGTIRRIPVRQFEEWSSDAGFWADTGRARRSSHAR
jgi:hypothetical protein